MRDSQAFTQGADGGEMRVEAARVTRAGERRVDVKIAPGFEIEKARRGVEVAWDGMEITL